LLARALGDYLDRTEPGAGILSSLATDRQAQSRAFAAEFLAPAASLRAALGDANLVEPEQVDDLGRRFGVAGEVIRRQIETTTLQASPRSEHPVPPGSGTDVSSVPRS
jgi:hypothetical protein